MLTDRRKKELLDELRTDIEDYVNRICLVQEFIDSTCQTNEETQFIRNSDWWVVVQDGGDYE